MLGGRYLATFFPLIWGAPRRNPRRMASRRDELGGLHKLWCMNLTLFFKLRYDGTKSWQALAGYHLYRGRVVADA